MKAGWDILIDPRAHCVLRTGWGSPPNVRVQICVENTYPTSERVDRATAAIPDTSQGGRRSAYSVRRQLIRADVTSGWPDRRFTPASAIDFVYLAR